MSFWSDASPIVKGAIVVGAIGILVSLMAMMGVGPFATDTAEVQQTRGMGG